VNIPASQTRRARAAECDPFPASGVRSAPPNPLRRATDNDGFRRSSQSTSSPLDAHLATELFRVARRADGIRELLQRDAHRRELLELALERAARVRLRRVRALLGAAATATADTATREARPAADGGRALCTRAGARDAAVDAAARGAGAQAVAAARAARDAATRWSAAERLVKARHLGVGSVGERVRGGLAWNEARRGGSLQLASAASGVDLRCVDSVRAKYTFLVGRK
jgi:hypothetical protein